MKTLIAVALSTTLIASTALAADVSPLATGKPAGVKQAQAMNIGTTGWVLLGVGVLTAIAVGVASSSNGSPLQSQNNLAVTATTV